MAVNEFNLYPYKATFPVPATGTKKVVQVTRAIFDGNTLTIWQERNGDISSAYTIDLDPDDFMTKGTPGSIVYKWTDPATGTQGSLQKYTGCSCKYRNTELSRITNPS